VLRTVERAHPSVRLVPEAEIEEVAVDLLADGGDVIHVPPIHANEVDGAVARNASASAEGFGKKDSERFVRHLPGSHSELAMPTFRARVAADPDVVGRIQEGRIDRSIVANDRTKEVEVTAIAATNAMLATNPDIAETGAGLGGAAGIVSSSGTPFKASSTSISPVIVGAESRPNRLGGEQPAMPAIRTPSTSMSGGLAKPNWRMEAAISATCFFECVRAFRGSGLMLFVGR
jgi:hypothetical protein